MRYAVELNLKDRTGKMVWQQASASDFLSVYSLTHIGDKFSFATREEALRAIKEYRNRNPTRIVEVAA